MILFQRWFHCLSRLKRTLWKPGFIYKGRVLLGRVFILVYAVGNLATEFYRVRCQARLRIITRPWSEPLLEFSYWHSTGSSLYFLLHLLSWVWFWNDPVKIKNLRQEALAKYWSLTSVGETESDSGVTWTKKQATRGNTLQYFGWLLQLVELTLIPEQPGQKKRHVFVINQ